MTARLACTHPVATEKGLNCINKPWSSADRLRLALRAPTLGPPIDADVSATLTGEILSPATTSGLGSRLNAPFGNLTMTDSRTAFTAFAFRSQREA